MGWCCYWNGGKGVKWGVDIEKVLSHRRALVWGSGDVNRRLFFHYMHYAIDHT